MPGGRLTHEDRQRIAEGLAEGLGYAEIARRLGRPTSTVSREVARNSGPAGYRADQAQQVTKRRARRRSPAPSPTAPGADLRGRDSQAVRQFEEEFAAMMVRTGLTPMMARVLACLYTSDSGSHTSADLVQRLRVSPASISKAIGYLERLEMVRRERDPRLRRERYSIDEDVWYRAWVASTRSIALWADATRHGAEVLGADTPAGARLDATSRFFHHLGHDMTTAAEHWRQTLSARQSPHQLP
ncbi:GbsR/MarR family transcriptional regulator [Streptoalloteichus hindustanus]|uniref:MarR family protein n=1 Tax=Streptoalloteichus hindustanus TaxID=2017 RepID=A0A1M5FCF1_STRHI|nr:helix-turn-helix domain-containing protein [Streptoalloteichus hindustanus]SHF89214.1 MarR family protein [Streptoalloteichus hindustanus]